MVLTATLTDVSPLDRLRALILDNEALQFQLGAIDAPEQFAASCVSVAQAHGIQVASADVMATLRPDPLGLRQFSNVDATRTSWPPTHWLPTSVRPMPGGRIIVTWSFFGGSRLDEPFFDMSARSIVQRPINQFVRYCMTLDDFVGAAPAHGVPKPGGFVFHMSRCGSTLVAQMLASLPRHIVVSEAPPLDAIIELSGLQSDVPASEHERRLVAMITALGRQRFAEDETAFFKLDSWHTLALPLFRRAFPTVPWVFLFRDPLEVVVSQMRQRGLQTIPGAVPSLLYGIERPETMPGEEYCARILAKICGAAVEHANLGGAIFVNYAALPDAMLTQILPHFGVSMRDGDRGRLDQAAGRNAKAPYMAFASDQLDKQRGATGTIRDAVAHHFDPLYETLQVLR